MKQSRAALRYAKATLDLATEQKAGDTVQNDMHTISDTIGQNKALQNLLQNPVIPTTAKKEAVQHIFSTSHPITKSLINTLTQNKRIALLAQVAHTYPLLYEKQKGEKVAHLTTAVPLTPELEERIKNQLTKNTGDNVTLKNTVTPNLLGGFVLRIGDLQYDASIANTLNRLRTAFTNPT